MTSSCGIHEGVILHLGRCAICDDFHKSLALDVEIDKAVRRMQTQHQRSVTRKRARAANQKRRAAEFIQQRAHERAF